MSRLYTIKKHLEDLTSTDPDKVRKSYEWLAANARENTRALVAIIDSQKTAFITGSFLENLNNLMLALKSDDAAVAKKAADEFNAPGNPEACVNSLLKEVNGQYDVLYMCAELLVEWFRWAKQNNWKITPELKKRTDATLAIVDGYAAIKEK